MTATLAHIVSCTALTGGEQLAMCGYVFPSYATAVADGHAVGNYLARGNTLSSYHARGVDCETCIVRHARASVSSDSAGARLLRTVTQAAGANVVWDAEHGWHDAAWIAEHVAPEVGQALLDAIAAQS